MSNYDKAITARDMYRMGRISKKQALEMMAGYIEEFDLKARELGRKYNVRPRLFKFEAFCR